MLAVQALDAAAAALVVVAVAAVVDAVVVAAEAEAAAVKASRPIGNAGSVARLCLAARQSALNAEGLEVGAAVVEAVAAAAMAVQLQHGLLTRWRFQSATARWSEDLWTMLWLHQQQEQVGVVRADCGVSGIVAHLLKGNANTFQINGGASHNGSTLPISFQ
jgi:hypothetical protein